MYSRRLKISEMASVAKDTRQLTDVNTALLADLYISLNFSASWIDGFKKSYSVRAFNSYGESVHVDKAVLEEQLPAIKEVLSKFVLKDVFNTG